jgi:hypothetical protein
MTDVEARLADAKVRRGGRIAAHAVNAGEDALRDGALVKGAGEVVRVFARQLLGIEHAERTRVGGGVFRGNISQTDIVELEVVVVVVVVALCGGVVEFAFQ